MSATLPSQRSAFRTGAKAFSRLPPGRSRRIGPSAAPCWSNFAKGGQALANTTVYNRADLVSIAQASLSLGYKDECTTFSINYAMTPRIAATGERETDRTVLVRLELRTLGQANLSQSLNTSSTADGLTTR